MDCRRRTFELFLTLSIIIIFLPTWSIRPANSQAIPQPTVPDFTVKVTKASYNVVDPQTGALQQIDNSSIEFTVKNQPFKYSINDITFHLYYKFRMKPHSEENWTEQNPVLYLPNSPYNTTIQSFSNSYYIWNAPPLPTQSNSSYTVVLYFLNSPQNWGLTSDTVDFQAQAIVGHDSQRWVVEHALDPNNGGHYEPAIAYVTDSGWSSTQTVTIPASSPAPSPTVPEFSALAILLLLIVLVLSLLLFRGHRKNTEKK